MKHEIEVIQHPQMAGLNLFVISVEYRTPHLHRDFELNLILDGAADFYCSGTSHTVQTGDLLLLNPNQLHEIHSASGVTLLCLQIQPQHFQPLIPEVLSIRFDSMFPNLYGDRCEWIQVQKTLLQIAALYIERPRYYALRCMGYLHFIVAQLLTSVPFHRLSNAELHSQYIRVERLSRLLDYVDKNYTHKVRLSDYAQQEQLTLTYLSHFVKENLNQTFQEYVTTVRFNQARKLLLSTDKRILDICLECGFSDPRYLTKCFLCNTGLRPEEYRHQNAGKPPWNEMPVHKSDRSSQRFYSDQDVMALLAAYQSNLPA